MARKKKGKEEEAQATGAAPEAGEQLQADLPGQAAAPADDLRQDDLTAPAEEPGSTQAEERQSIHLQALQAMAQEMTQMNALMQHKPPAEVLQEAEALRNQPNEDFIPDLAEALRNQPNEDFITDLAKSMCPPADDYKQYMGNLAAVVSHVSKTLTEVIERANRAIQASLAENQAIINYGQAIYERLTNLIDAETINGIRILGIIAPYIEIEYGDNQDKYGKEAIEEFGTEVVITRLLLAGIDLAREAGKDIPPLKIEQIGYEQLQMQLDFPDTDKKEEATTAIIEYIPALTPQAHVMPNNALMNVLKQPGAINGGAFDLPVLPARKRQKEITAYTIIDLETDETGKGIINTKLSEHERQVSDAVISLWWEANRQGVQPVFTTDAVYRAMPGGSDAASPQQKGAIAKAIEKLRSLHITVDATEEMRKRGVIDDNERFELDEFYFVMRRAKLTPKHSNQPVYAYWLRSKPIILEYAEKTKQILTVQPRYLTITKVKDNRPTPELIPMNKERQAMTGYMMRRIAIMKHDLEEARERFRQYEKRRKTHPELQLEEKPLESFRKQSRTILFDTLFAEADAETENREQARRNREFCFDVLDYWQATNFIKGYSTQNKGRKITGISIEI